VADPAGYITTSTLSNAVTASIDQYVRAELRHMPLLRNLADTRPVQVDRPGSSVALYTRGDMAAATTPLSETADPDAVALPNPTAVTLTPLEYGNVSIATLKVKATSFFDVDPDQRDAIVWNMRDTLDELVHAKLIAGTNVAFASADHDATAELDNTDVITTAYVRKIVARLRAAGAQGKVGDLYYGGVHPDVSHDLRAESGSGGWQDLHKYAAPGVFWPGNIGVYEGVMFVESARFQRAEEGADSDGTAGSEQYSTYNSIFAGKEALAEGVQVEPEVRIGVVPDKLNRFFPLGWYGYLGWTLFRQNAIWRLESGSSIDPNV
jgi:N4-gp56 family major capsid protein